MSELRPDPALLLELVRARMPFGKYAGLRLLEEQEGLGTDDKLDRAAGGQSRVLVLG